MKATILTTILTAGTLISAQVASAQSYATRNVNNGTPVIQHHASTYAEGVMRGYADMVRAAGDYNYNTSLALINQEEARRRYFDNKQKYVETYFAMRETNRLAREKERGPRPTQQDIERFSKMRSAKRLATHDMNPVSGSLNWPVALGQEQFGRQRTAIDRLFAERARYNGGLAAGDQQQVVALSVELQDELKAQVRSLSPSDYIAAKNFLRGLELEAKTAPTLIGLAAR